MTLSEKEFNKPDAEEKEGRLKQFKNLGKPEELRRRRNECSVEIRKQKGADMLMKRRNLQEDDNDDLSSESEVEQKPVTATPKLTNAEIVKILQSNPTVEQLRTCFETIRRTLSRSKNPPVDEVIQCGLLAALVQGLLYDDEKVRFESAWAITNIVSGNSDQTLAAVQAGVTKPLVELSVNPSMALAEQALWAVANIAGDSAQLRDHVIECGGVEALMMLVNNLDKMEVSFVRTLAWAFSNMCRHKNPHAPLRVLSTLSHGLTKLVAHSDKSVKQDACWAVSYLTDGPDEQIVLAKECGVLPYVMEFLRDQDGMVAPALRVLGNMATGNDELTQIVIDLGTLKEVVSVVERSRSTTVVKECCWLLSNIIAGTQQQIQAVIDANVMPLIIEVLRSGDFKCQFEASWAIANLAQGGTTDQILTLLRDDALPVLCQVLTNSNTDLLCNALETISILLNNILNFYPDQLEKAKDIIEECGGLDTLERLQESECEKVYHLAYRVIADFFSEDENDPVDPVQDGGVNEYNF